MRKPVLFFCLVLMHVALYAQWTPRALKHKSTQRLDFFIPLAMHFSDTSNGFILNNGGLLQYSNYQWQPITTNVDALDFTFTNLFSYNPRNTYFCANDGKIARYDGNNFEVLFTVPQTDVNPPAFNAIFMTDSLRGWAAGDGGQVIKIDDRSFYFYNIPSSVNCTDIYFDREDHGWLVGYTDGNPGRFGVVYEFDNDQWTLFSYLDENLYDIEFAGQDSGFIAGQQAMYRFNKTEGEWQTIDIPNYYPQHHLSMAGESYGISVSDNNSVLIYDNGNWQTAPGPGVSDLVGIKAIAPGAAWAISQSGTGSVLNNNEGKIQRMENNSWQEFSLNYLDQTTITPVDYVFTNIRGIGKKDIWLNGQYLKLPADSNWADTVPVINSDVYCNTARMYSDSFGLGTEGGIQQWNGSDWINRYTDPANPDTSFTNLAMHLFDDTTAFVARQILIWNTGDFKTIISPYNYTTNQIAPGTQLDERTPLSIHFANKRHGWCVGENGMIAKFTQPDVWQLVPAITPNRLNAVFTLDSVTAWVAGDNGTLLRYDGDNWNPVTLPTDKNLYALYFTDKNHGWLSGDSGLIFHYNSGVWTQDSSGTNEPLFALYMADTTYGFAAGENGTLLQFLKNIPDTTTHVDPPPAPQRTTCENGNTWFVYHPEGSGYSYQWQVDTGNGFENLIADNIYSGVQTDSLYLTAMPASLYGYKFRCIATQNGVDSISAAEELKFINHWTGDSSTAWENPANWSCGAVPGPHTDVEISSGEIILSSEASIRSLKVQPGVNITIAEGGSLLILK